MSPLSFLVKNMTSSDCSRPGRRALKPGITPADIGHMEGLWSILFDFCSETAGQDLIEYSLLLAFLALAAVAILGDVKGSVINIYSKAGSVLNSAAATAAAS